MQDKSVAAPVSCGVSALPLAGTAIGMVVFKYNIRNTGGSP